MSDAEDIVTLFRRFGGDPSGYKEIVANARGGIQKKKKPPVTAVDVASVCPVQPPAAASIDAGGVSEVNANSSADSSAVSEHSQSHVSHVRPLPVQPRHANPAEGEADISAGKNPFAKFIKNESTSKEQASIASSGLDASGSLNGIFRRLENARAPTESYAQPAKPVNGKV